MWPSNSSTPKTIAMCKWFQWTWVPSKARYKGPVILSIKKYFSNHVTTVRVTRKIPSTNHRETRGKTEFNYKEIVVFVAKKATNSENFKPYKGKVMM